MLLLGTQPVNDLPVIFRVRLLATNCIMGFSSSVNGENRKGTSIFWVVLEHFSDTSLFENT